MHALPALLLVLCLALACDARVKKRFDPKYGVNLESLRTMRRRFPAFAVSEVFSAQLNVPLLSLAREISCLSGRLSRAYILLLSPPQLTHGPRDQIHTCNGLILTRRSHQPYRFVPAENAPHRGVRAPPSTFTVIYNAGTPTTVKTAVDYVLNLVRATLCAPLPSYLVTVAPQRSTNILTPRERISRIELTLNTIHPCVPHHNQMHCNRRA